MIGWLLRQMGHLYRIEKELREKRVCPQLRAAVRAHQKLLFLLLYFKCYPLQEVMGLLFGMSGVLGVMEP